MSIEGFCFFCMKVTKENDLFSLYGMKVTNMTCFLFLSGKLVAFRVKCKNKHIFTHFYNKGNGWAGRVGGTKKKVLSSWFDKIECAHLTPRNIQKEVTLI